MASFIFSSTAFKGHLYIYNLPVMGDGILTVIQGEPKWKDLILAKEPLTS